MKNKIIKLVMCVLALCMILNTNVSYAATTKTTTANQTKTFTVDEAIKYALSNNGDILKVKFQQDQLGYTITGIKDGRKMVEALIEMAENTPGVSVVETLQAKGQYNFDGYLLRQKFTERQLSAQKNLLNMQYTMRTELIKLSVENAYYKVLMQKIAYDDAKRNLDVVKKQTELGAIKLKYGTISELDYKSLEINQNAAEISLLNAEFAMKEANYDFCDLLGLSYDTTLNLTSPLEVKVKDITLTEKKKTDLKNNDVVFQSAKTTYDFAEEKNRLAKAYYGSSSNEYKNEELTFKAEEINYKNAQNTVERKIISTQNTLEVMKKTVAIYKDKKDLMNLALGIANIRLNYGTATNDDVITASINYNNALNEYYDMVMNYNMMVSLYDKNIMIG